MNFIVWVILGALLSPLFGLGSFHRDDFNIPALFVSLMAAIMTLVIVILAKEETKFRRRTRYRHATHPSRQ